MDAISAFISFLVDIFSALSAFLTGSALGIDLSGLLEGLTGKATETDGE